jgi:hypothetical protein
MGITASNNPTECSPVVLTRFIGEFASLSALETAHPTAQAGSYAIVNQSGTDVIYYFSTADDEWFTNSGGPLGTTPTLQQVLNEGSTATFTSADGDVLQIDEVVNSGTDFYHQKSLTSSDSNNQVSESLAPYQSIRQGNFSNVTYQATNQDIVAPINQTSGFMNLVRSLYKEIFSSSHTGSWNLFFPTPKTGASVVNVNIEMPYKEVAGTYRVATQDEIFEELDVFKTENFIDFTSSGQGQLNAKADVKKARLTSMIQNNTSTQLNTALTFYAEANEVYYVEYDLIGGGSGAAGARFIINAPSGSSGSFTALSIQSTNNIIPSGLFGVGSLSNTIATASTSQKINIVGVFTNGSTAGNVILSFASGGAQTTQLQSGSRLIAIKA